MEWIFPHVCLYDALGHRRLPKSLARSNKRKIEHRREPSSILPGCRRSVALFPSSHPFRAFIAPFLGHRAANAFTAPIYYALFSASYFFSSWRAIAGQFGSPAARFDLCFQVRGPPENFVSIQTKNRLFLYKYLGAPLLFPLIHYFHSEFNPITMLNG